ncbi:MAG: 4Fe-4S dicluster domain-containing protein [Deltaproteobacteria bacterium]|nr:4Fe-4S dicluster domain-containing protein [Deltaproteobacteria bacterium]
MDKNEVMDRKTFLKMGFLKVAEPFVAMVESKVKEATKRRVLRPPGAIEEVAFLTKCTRCDDCVTACHQKAIKHASEYDGLAAGTPIVVPNEMPCYLCDEFVCITACIEGALQMVKREEVKMGIAAINTKRCHRWAGIDPMCDYCFDRCPLKGKAICLDDKGPEIDDKKCAGCGICEYVCPSDPKAVIVTPL